MTQLNIYAPLKEVFGYDTFRLLQEEIVRTVVSGEDAVVIMPTDGGSPCVSNCLRCSSLG